MFLFAAETMIEILYCRGVSTEPNSPTVAEPTV